MNPNYFYPWCMPYNCYAAYSDNDMSQLVPLSDDELEILNQQETKENLPEKKDK